MIRCSICGRENEDTFRYCLDCGSDIGAAAAPTQAATEAKAKDLAGSPEAAGPTPIPLTELAPPTGVMPMQSASTGPAAPPPSVSQATPPAGVPRHTPVPPSPLEATAPSATPSNPAATPGPGHLPPPLESTAASQPVPAISAPAPAAPAPAPDHARPCSTCGNEVAAGHVFCGSCGGRADAAGPPPASSASTAAAAAAGGTMVMGAMEAPELAAQRFKVTVITPEGNEARTVPLTGAQTVAGDKSAAIPIPEDPFVVPAHLTLSETAGVLRVQDGGSETGTFLKINVGTPVPLPSGAALRLGRQRLRLESVAAPDPEAAADGTLEWGSPDHGARYRLIQELEGGDDGTAWLLAEGAYNIGREQGELTFPGDGYVSGTHGKLQIGPDGRATYEDLGSSNGSFLRLTTETVVSEGDFLLVGMHLLRIDLQ